jgi:hypothetical protein
LVTPEGCSKLQHSKAPSAQKQKTCGIRRDAGAPGKPPDKSVRTSHLDMDTSAAFVQTATLLTTPETSSQTGFFFQSPIANHQSSMYNRRTSGGCNYAKALAAPVISLYSSLLQGSPSLKIRIPPN